MTYTDFNIEIGGKTTGEVSTVCPKCSQDRKKKNIKCLSVNLDKGTWFCQHCGWKGGLRGKKLYVMPTWENKTELSDAVVEWFLKRGISQDTLIAMDISESVEFIPQKEARGRVIGFPYYRDGKLVNIKFRDREKNFFMVKGAEKIFYNIDAVKESPQEVIVVEGELDLITLVQLGYKGVLSVPNGATLANNNLDYLDNCWQVFEAVERLIIATDNDKAGDALAAEIARRVGIEKCYRARFGPYKDANEMYVKTAAVDLQISPMPIAGVYSIDMHREGVFNILRNGFPQGWKPRGELGRRISIHPGYMTMITGIPSHGKSEIIDQVCLEISLDHKLRGSFFSPENRPTEIHVIKLIEKLCGKKFWDIPVPMINHCMDVLEDMVYWNYPDDGYGIDSLLELVRQSVVRYGINWYVIDPWNRIEHHYTDSETKYISETLDKISNFNHKHQTHSFIVAHPTKMKFDHVKGRYDVPGLYDISGSANFFNKTDIGMAMYKDGPGKNRLIIQKVKYKYWGDGPGEIQLNWNPENGRYYEHSPDNAPWITVPGVQQTRIEDFDNDPPF